MSNTGGGSGMVAPFSHTFPDHPCHLLEQLNMQRYYGAFCDVIVRIEDYDFKVHQCVLAASCPKLQTAIYSLKHECTVTQSVLNIKEISVAGFRIVLDFLYTGTLKLDLVQVNDVLSTARYLEIGQVEKACLDYQYYKGVSSGINEGPSSSSSSSSNSVVQSQVAHPLSIGQVQDPTPPPQPPPPPVALESASISHTQIDSVESPPDGYRTGATTAPPSLISAAVMYHHSHHHSHHHSNHHSHHPSEVQSQSLSSLPPPPPPQSIPPTQPQTHHQPMSQATQPATPSSQVSTQEQQQATSSTSLPPPPPPPSQMSTMPSVSSSLAFDTNYIEDYLKLIESLQGGVTAAAEQQQSQSVPMSTGTSTSSSMMRYSGSASRSIPQLSTDSRYTTNIGQSQIGAASLTTQPKPLGFPSATGQPGTYSAEDMRKTILSVLSQERFDDDEDDEDVDDHPQPSSVPPDSRHSDQHLDKYDSSPPSVPPPPLQQQSSAAIPDHQVNNNNGSHHSMGGSGGSIHSDVDIGPPTLTPEPACVLPSIINIVPHHRRKPPDISEVMPLSSGSSQSMAVSSDNSPAAPTLVPSCQTLGSVSDSEELDDSDLVCAEGTHCDDSCLDDASVSCHHGHHEHPVDRLGGPTQNACLINLDEASNNNNEEFHDRISRDDHMIPNDNNNISQMDKHNLDVTEFDATTAIPTNATDANDPLECAATPTIKSGKLSKKQKRKKKTPVKLNRQQPTDSDGDDATNFLVKHERATGVSSAILKKRGRPKNKEQTKPLKKRDITTTTGTTERRKIVCDQCGRGFGKQELLNKHKEMHQRALLYACHICGMKYARPAELTRHQRTHSDVTFHCTECNHMFSDPRDFKKHMEHHGVEKPFFCTFPGCAFRSAKPSIVEKHMVIHSGVKMHPCERCGKMFAQPSGLRSHLRSCLQQRSYLCDFCGSSFNHLQSLKSHRMLHTGEKPYFCHDCGARFTDHRNFKRHRRIHDGSFPYACMHCDKNFRHSNSLKAHLKTHGINLAGATLEEVKANHFEVKMKEEDCMSDTADHPIGPLNDLEDPTHIAGHVIQVKGETLPDDNRVRTSRHRGHSCQGQDHIESQVQGQVAGAVATANVC